MQRAKDPVVRPGLLLVKKPRRVSRPMGAKGTGIIFGGGVYVAENTSREASVELAAFGGQ